MSAKADKAVEIARKALAANKAVVFGFALTGKSALDNLLESEVRGLTEGQRSSTTALLSAILKHQVGSLLGKPVM
jgi:hypothetical protein